LSLPKRSAIMFIAFSKFNILNPSINLSAYANFILIVQPEENAGDLY